MIIAAGTARGKTEAAFLPILSRISRQPGAGIRALCVSPLKALINDQFRRLEDLCGELHVPLYRWHGDVPAGFKRKLLKHPEGILVITPESLEALFVLHGSQIGSLFAGLSYCVIDELHAFLGTERGRQLQSLLHRLEIVLDRRVSRIGLSATLGDMGLACEFLRSGGGAAVRSVVSNESGQEVRIQVRGYRLAAALRLPLAGGEEDREEETVEESENDIEIAKHLFTTLRGGHHLVFANSRAVVEQYADRLRHLCKDLDVPNEFWPHHGNLSKALREETEAAIKDRSRPATAICTMTLELGIDIGAIESIAQVGPPSSVASTRQRLGRSGRQGGPAVLRAYVQEREVQRDASPNVALRVDLVQTIAIIQLLLAGWCEPPERGALHLSTLVQQILSLVAQYGAVRAEPAWVELCRQGPFSAVSRAQFAAVLRSLASQLLIQQDHSGELVLAQVGERIVNHYGFYAAFTSPEEFRIVAAGRTLGSMPIQASLTLGSFLIFGGRRWKVVGIDAEQKTIDVCPATGGRLPMFDHVDLPPVHDRVRREMFALLGSTAVAPYLDRRARELLQEGRDNFARFGLAEAHLLAWGDATLVFLWCGDRILDTLVLWFQALGITAHRARITLFLPQISMVDADKLLRRLADEKPPAGIELARTVSNLRREKFHPYLSDELLAEDYAVARLDVLGAREAIHRLFYPKGGGF